MAEERTGDEAVVQETDKNENLTQTLDKLEMKVEHFRSKAQELEQEKEKLLRDLQILQCQSSSPTSEVSEASEGRAHPNVVSDFSLLFFDEYASYINV